jgi:isopenicillin-N epimerase
MERLWEFVRRRTGATVTRRPFGDLDPGPRTRVVYCSHIEWSTGRVNDLAPLVASTRAAGVLLVVDGAHAPGQLDLDLESLGADLYAGNCHKWLCAPKGSGFLYARPEAHHLIEPTIVSWDWLDDAPFPDRHRWQGTRDPSAYLAVPAAIEFQAEHDWPSVRARCHRLLSSLDLPFAPLTDTYVQMRGFRVDDPDPPALKRHLYDEHRIEVPIVETPAGWVMRVSVQAYNDESDLTALASAVEAWTQRSRR